MSLSVTRAAVKEKARVSVADFDTLIDNLIAAWVPAVEYAVRDDVLADTGNTGLQATLNLGALEMVAGELLAQLARTPGADAAQNFGWIDFRPLALDLADPFGLKRQGALRLKPFLKTLDGLQGTLGVMAGGSRSEEEEA